MAGVVPQAEHRRDGGRGLPPRAAPEVTIATGRARCGRRTKDLVQRLRRGEIAVIDHDDLDGAAARALLACRPAAVVNAASFISGRYPNSGPGILLDAGIPLLDAAGADLFDVVRDGDPLRWCGATLYRGEEAVALGTPLTRERLAERLKAARQNLQTELQAFSENTLRYLAAEAAFATADLPLPPLRTSLRSRPALVVVRGEGCREDLAAIRGYIRDARPVLIGVDGGADALLEAGFRPDLIIGDMDSATDAALRCGAELVVHTYPDGRRSPAQARLRALGLASHALPAPGTSEDVAMLLAYQGGAELIVAVGTHFSLVEFLDKRRAGMASTFLTRLKVGSILVDAKGARRLYQPGPPLTPILLLVLAAATPILVIALHSPAVQRWFSVAGMAIGIWLRRLGLG
jgi:uncharacterized membrane-anchored protein